MSPLLAPRILRYLLEFWKISVPPVLAVLVLNFRQKKRFISSLKMQTALRAPYTLKGPIHSKLNCAVSLRKNTARKTELNILWHSTGFPSGLSVFFVSSVCLLVRVTMVDKIKAIVCCLLTTSAIMLSEKKKRKRKMCSKKWYLNRNISCDAHLLNELLETGVPWDDATVVSAGKLRKLWDSPSEMRSSLCERRLERQLWGLRYCLSKLRSLLRFSVRYDVTE